MTAPINRDFKNPTGVTHFDHLLSLTRGSCESTETQQRRLPSPQRGRGAGGEGERRVVVGCLPFSIQPVSLGFIAKSPLRATPPHPQPLSRVGERGADLSGALQLRRPKGLVERSKSLGVGILLACLWMFLLVPSPGVLAQAKKADKPTEEPASTKPQETGDRQQHAQKVFTIKHGDVNAIAQTLRIYPVDVRPNRELQVIGVSAPAALMPTIEDTIRRLDVSPAPPIPPPAPKNVEFTVYLLLASDQEVSAGSVPPDLESVVKQLEVTFAFKRFRIVDTLVVRSRDRYGASVNGIARFDPDVPHSSTYGFSYKAASVSSDEKGRSIRLDGLRFSARIVTGRDGAGVPVENSDAGFGTDLDVREGQKVVVGKAAVGGTNTSLILVITAKVLE